MGPAGSDWGLYNSDIVPKNSHLEKAEIMKGILCISLCSMLISKSSMLCFWYLQAWFAKPSFGRVLPIGAKLQIAPLWSRSEAARCSLSHAASRPVRLTLRQHLTRLALISRYGRDTVTQSWPTLYKSRGLPLVLEIFNEYIFPTALRY